MSDPINDPVPVAVGNSTIMKHHSYEAIFDYLSLNNISIEKIPAVRFSPGDKKWENLNDNLRNIIDVVKEESCSRHVAFAIGGTDYNKIAKKAIKVFIKHIETLLKTFQYKDLSGTYTISLYQYLCSRRAGKRLHSSSENHDTWKKLQRWVEDVSKLELDEICHDLKISASEFESKYGSDPKQYFEDLYLKATEMIAEKNVSELKSLITDELRGAIKVIDDFSDFRLFGKLINLVMKLKPEPPLSPAIGEFESKIKKKDTYYMSSIMEYLNSFLEDRPYCSLPSYFTNPHEDNVDIYFSGRDYPSESSTSSAFLKFLQPGMHTRRLGYGSRMFITTNGDLVYNDGLDIFRYDFGKTQGIGTKDLGYLGDELNNSIPQILGLGKPQKLYNKRVEKITAEWFSGEVSVGRTFCKRGGQLGTPQSRLIGRLDSEENTSEFMLIPKSYSITWNHSISESGVDTTSYKIQKIKETDGNNLKSTRHHY